MKIVVLDGYTENPGDLSWDGLASLGDLTVYDKSPAKTVIGRIGDAEIVYTNKTPLDASIFNACPNIRFVGVLATGYNVVDIKAANARGITVCNVPSYGTMVVSQFAIALLLEICHRIGHHDRTVHEGRWEKSDQFCYWDYPLIELAGKTMGIIGFGRIGHQTGKLAAALGMNVIAYTPHPPAETSFSGECRFVELDAVWKESDVIALHCPLRPETEGLINKKTISKMKDGVIIINNSRGALIVEQDLADALNSGKVYAAGLDVVSKEPISCDNPLLRAKNCIITPHISWASRESRQRLMDIAVENLVCYLNGSPQNVVRP